MCWHYCTVSKEEETHIICLPTAPIFLFKEFWFPWVKLDHPRMQSRSEVRRRMNICWQIQKGGKEGQQHQESVKACSCRLQTARQFSECLQNWQICASKGWAAMVNYIYSQFYMSTCLNCLHFVTPSTFKKQIHKLSSPILDRYICIGKSVPYTSLRPLKMPSVRQCGMVLMECFMAWCWWSAGIPGIYILNICMSADIFKTDLHVYSL